MWRSPAAARDAEAQFRVRREAEFHDAAFAGQSRRRAAKFYLAARAAKAHYRALVLSGGLGRVLEYGCGQGSAAFDLALRGARVTGIDISPVGLLQGRRRAADMGLADRLDFQRMDAEALAFEANTFELVCGSGILHHLDLDRALAEVGRVLKPAGAAVFFEPLGHNPLIQLYRRLTPAMRSADEHPLRMADLERLTSAFAEADLSFFGLFTLAAVPFGPGPESPALRALERLDGVALRAGRLRRYAWIVVAHLRRPAAPGEASGWDRGR